MSTRAVLVCCVSRGVILDRTKQSRVKQIRTTLYAKYPTHSPARINNSNVLRHAHLAGLGNGGREHGHTLGVRDDVALGKVVSIVKSL